MQHSCFIDFYLILHNISEQKRKLCVTFFALEAVLQSRFTFEGYQHEQYLLFVQTNLCTISPFSYYELGRLQPHMC